MYSWSVKVHRKVCHCHCHCYSKRTACATARRVSSTDFCPSRRSAQMVCSWRCKVWVDFLRRLAGGWPRAFCSSVVHAVAATLWHTRSTSGCAPLTPRIPPLALVIRPVVAVQRGDMYVPCGHREQRRQRTQRDAWNRGAVVVVVSCRSDAPPLTYVALKYVMSVCSLSASSMLGTQPCSTCMPSATSDSGRKARPSIIPSDLHGFEIYSTATIAKIELR